MQQLNNPKGDKIVGDYELKRILDNKERMNKSRYFEKLSKQEYATFKADAENLKNGWIRILNKLQLSNKEAETAKARIESAFSSLSLFWGRPKSTVQKIYDNLENLIGKALMVLSICYPRKTVGDHLRVIAKEVMYKAFWSEIYSLDIKSISKPDFERKVIESYKTASKKLYNRVLTSAKKRPAEVKVYTKKNDQIKLKKLRNREIEAFKKLYRNNLEQVDYMIQEIEKQSP